MRKQFTLNDEEDAAFRRLRPFQGAAFSFWRRVALARGLDPTSIISDAPRFSGLPLAHNKNWCYPSPLKCAKAPPAI